LFFQGANIQKYFNNPKRRLRHPVPK